MCRICNIEKTVEEKALIIRNTEKLGKGNDFCVIKVGFEHIFVFFHGKSKNIHKFAT